MAKIFRDYFGVVDLETLGNGSDACILSMGLTMGRYDQPQTFDQLVAGGLYVKFDLKEQLGRGRRKSERVIRWWQQQSAEARKVIVPGPSDVSLYGIDKILKDYFWSKNGMYPNQVDLYDRNCFDLSKLQYLYEEDLGMDVPWDYRHTFDIPTAFRFMGFDRYADMRADDVPGCTYHNALHDAALDQLRIYKVLHDDQFEG